MEWIKKLKQNTKTNDIIKKEKQQRDLEISQIVVDKYYELKSSMQEAKVLLDKKGIDINFSSPTDSNCSLSIKEKIFDLSRDPEDRQIFFKSPAGEDTIIYNNISYFFVSVINPQKEVNFNVLMVKHVRSLSREISRLLTE